MGKNIIYTISNKHSSSKLSDLELKFEYNVTWAEEKKSLKDRSL